MRFEGNWVRGKKEGPGVIHEIDGNIKKVIC